MQRKIKISEICDALKLKYIGKDISINGLNLCNRQSAHNQILTYVTNKNFVETVRNNEAIASIILSKMNFDEYRMLGKEKETSFIVTDNPESVFYDIHDYLFYHTDFYDKFEFPAEIGEESNIHPTAVIEKGVKIGKRVQIGAHTVVKKGTIIQDDCVIGCNSTIGSEGFQIIKDDNKNRRIVHCGGVQIGTNTSIGDNVTVCNSLFENTACIGSNVMIDNHAYIAHNVVIGDSAVITASTVLCGSSIVESGAWIGVNSSVLNRVTIGCDSKIGIGSVVTRDISENSLAYGVPAKVKTVFEDENKNW